MNQTKQKILDTAERLFGENGYAATSLRHIIAEAQVNLAAIHYHFGSKQDLLDQVILRKAGPMNEHRLKLLDQFEAEAAPLPVSLEKIIEAFVLPAILIEKSPDFVRLIGRVHAEGLMPGMAHRNFGQLIVRFRASLHQALPEMPEGELTWRVHFAIGAMSHALCTKPESMPGDGPVSPAVLCNMLVAFMSNGFHAPATPELEIEVNR